MTWGGADDTELLNIGGVQERKDAIVSVARAGNHYIVTATWEVQQKLMPLLDLFLGWVDPGIV